MSRTLQDVDPPLISLILTLNPSKVL